MADVPDLRRLAIESWSPYQKELDATYWQELSAILTASETFVNLLQQSTCFVAVTNEQDIVGMVFLVPSGNPTKIYQADWSYIRFLSVHPSHMNKGMGRLLTEHCIDYARKTDEHYIALHTSEMMKKAMRLYKNLGFRIIKEIDRSLGKRYWILGMEIFTENKES